MTDFLGPDKFRIIIGMARIDKQFVIYCNQLLNQAYSKSQKNSHRSTRK